jgi:hypothetical protein
MDINSNAITINFGSIFITYVILIGLALLGFRKGFRYMLSIALFLTLAYVLTVRGGEFVVDLVNRFWSNGPKLAAFAVGRDPGSVAPLDPLIPANFQAPWLLRVLVFIALVAIGVARTWPWEAALKPTVKPGHPLRILGLLTGLYTGVLGISAISTLWGQAPDNVRQSSNLLVTTLNGLPDFAAIVPSVIAAFFIMLLVIILLRLSRIWWIDKEREKDVFVIVTDKK